MTDSKNIIDRDVNKVRLNLRWLVRICLAQRMKKLELWTPPSYLTQVVRWVWLLNKY